jgi:hydroxyacylglutathione hydrolase
MLSIIPIPAFKDNYIWLLINNKNQHAIIADPGDATPVIKQLETMGLILSAILITHHHADHCGGLDILTRQFSIPVYGPEAENIIHVNQPVREGNTVTIPHCDISFSVLDIPGHTRGHIAYYSPGMVFCGDTLFTAGCGRLFEGTAEQMYHSLSKLCQYPDDTLIYCGHEYTSANLQFAQAVEPTNNDILERIKATNSLRLQGLPSVPAPLALEKRTNPFLRCQVKEVIEAAEKQAGNSLNNPVSVFSTLRNWKNSFQ